MESERENMPQKISMSNNLSKIKSFSKVSQKVHRLLFRTNFILKLNIQRSDNSTIKII